MLNRTNLNLRNPFSKKIISNSNMTSFFRFVSKRAIYRLGIISLAHAPVNVTDLPVVNVHVDELSSARIWQHKLCATLAANVNINYRIPIKAYYRICTFRHIRIEIIHGSKNSGFHDLFLNYKCMPSATRLYGQCIHLVCQCACLCL